MIFVQYVKVCGGLYMPHYPGGEALDPMTPSKTLKTFSLLCPSFLREFVPYFHLLQVLHLQNARR